jgi:hypothetical protein
MRFDDDDDDDGRKTNTNTNTNKSGCSTSSCAELLVYDFDGTLANTPTPREGKIMYENKIGQAWPHVGWWGRQESLEPPLEVGPGPAWASYVENRTRTDCVRIMMTGRVEKLSRRVTECLRMLEGATETLCFHELVFKKGNGDTLEYKCEELRRMVRAYGPKKVRIWEDRVKHAEGFREFGKREFAEIVFEVTLVEPSNDY